MRPRFTRMQALNLCWRGKPRGERKLGCRVRERSRSQNGRTGKIEESQRARPLRLTFVMSERTSFKYVDIRSPLAQKPHTPTAWFQQEEIVLRGAVGNVYRPQFPERQFLYS